MLDKYRHSTLVISENTMGWRTSWEEHKFKGFLQVKCDCMNTSNLWYACASTSIAPTLDFGLKVSPVWRAVAMCFTSSLRIPSSSSCFGSILIIPTSVLFIIKMPSVKMETEWVSFATYRKHLIIRFTYNLFNNRPHIVTSFSDAA